MEDKVNHKIKDFFGLCKETIYKKGEVIIPAYDEPGGIYLIKSGCVKMSTIFEDGSELAVNLFKPNSFFPLTWAIGDAPNTYFFQAIQPTVILKAPKEKFIKFVKENPDVLYSLTKRVLIGLDGLLFTIKYVLSGNSINKVATVLWMLSNRFGQKNDRGEILINLQITHQDIASHAGITRETTSLAIEKMKKNGILDRQNRKLVIKKPELLKNYYMVKKT